MSMSILISDANSRDAIPTLVGSVWLRFDGGGDQSEMHVVRKKPSSRDDTRTYIETPITQEFKEQNVTIKDPSRLLDVKTDSPYTAVTSCKAGIASQSIVLTTASSGRKVLWEWCRIYVTIDCPRLWRQEIWKCLVFGATDFPTLPKHMSLFRG